jgi:hypothetical protein
MAIEPVVLNHYVLAIIAACLTQPFAELRSQTGVGCSPVDRNHDRLSSRSLRLTTQRPGDG